MREGLWTTSLNWRRTLVATLLLTGFAGLTSPWGQRDTGSAPMASYTPPTRSAAARATVLPRPAPPVAALPVVGRTTTGQNPAFDVKPASSSAVLPAGTELHLIGVYEGAPPAGEREGPWWRNCMGLERDPKAALECQARYAGKRAARPVTVDVTRTVAPLALVLMAYEPVVWKLSIGANTRVIRIILAGNHGQDIEGIPGNVPIEARTRESSPCRTCTRQADTFFAYKQDSPEYDNVLTKLQTITGVAPTSFQGAYKADRFSIRDYLATTRTAAVPADDKGDTYTGHFFTDQIRVAGRDVSLPPGRWKGLSHIEAPSTRGRDKLVALRRADASSFMEITAIRVQHVDDANGFPKFAGCSASASHASAINANESFGAQLCYEVVHVTEPWSQPLLALAATQLRSDGISPADTVIASSFHGADKGHSVDLLHYAVPVTSAAAGNWDTSPLHPKNLRPSSADEGFIKEQVAWAKVWYQLLGATF